MSPKSHLSPDAIAEAAYYLWEARGRRQDQLKRIGSPPSAS